MRFRGLNLNLLIALLALLEERNVSRAGRRVFLSQSAMSGVLGRLREHYNDQLLEPSGRAMVLTPFAESLVEPVRRVVSSIDTLVSATSQFDPATSQRRFKMAMSDYLIQCLLPHAMPSIYSLAPGIGLEFSLFDGRAIEKLNEGSIDLVIARDSFVAPPLLNEHFVDEDHVAIAWTGNTAVGKALKLEDLRRATFAEPRTPDSLERAYGGRVQTFAALQLEKFDVQFNVDVTLPAAAACFAAVVGTSHLAIVPRRLVGVIARPDSIRTLELPVELAPMREVLIYHPLRSQDEGLAWLIDKLRTALATFDSKTATGQ